MPGGTTARKVRVLGVPDDYDPDEPELRALLPGKVLAFVESLNRRGGAHRLPPHRAVVDALLFVATRTIRGPGGARPRRERRGPPGGPFRLAGRNANSHAIRIVLQHRCWYPSGMAIRKLTVHVDADLLRRARKHTGEGVTATIRHGLELVAASEAYDRLRALRGKVKFTLDLETLREDRR